MCREDGWIPAFAGMTTGGSGNDVMDVVMAWWFWGNDVLDVGMMW